MIKECNGVLGVVVLSYNGVIKKIEGNLMRQEEELTDKEVLQEFGRLWDISIERDNGKSKQFW
jgi:hypothetical protein